MPLLCVFSRNDLGFICNFKSPLFIHLCDWSINRLVATWWYERKCFCNIREQPEQRTRVTATGEHGETSSYLTICKSRATEGDEDDAQPSTSTRENQDKDEENTENKDEEDKGEVVETVLTEEDLIQQSQAEYDSGRYSPALLTSSELPLDSHTITPEEDTHRLQLARRQLQVTGMRWLTHAHTHTQFQNLSKITFKWVRSEWENFPKTSEYHHKTGSQTMIITIL